jgi:thiol-disulfide isomerase/thioredoxin
VAVLLLPPALAAGQEGVEKQTDTPAPKIIRPAPPSEDMQKITDAYNQEVVQAERRRLERLALLAARQAPAAAAATYEQYFRLAVAANLFGDAGPIAETVVKNGSPSPTTRALAHLVKIIAEADRGAYEQSLESLRRAIEEKNKAEAGGAPGANLMASERVGLCDAYYQRLVHGGQFEIARKAFTFLQEQVKTPAVVEFVTARLKRLDLVGKPAPPVQGTDLDGKRFDLADAKGKVALVIFWASWCLPCAAEIEGFQQIADSYRAQGLQVVGINVDTLQDDGPKLDTVMPNVRRFLLDYNVRWPTLINGSGDTDYAKAYGVTEIPANVLIGKDGAVAAIDLVSKNAEQVIRRALGH